MKMIRVSPFLTLIVTPDAYGGAIELRGAAGRVPIEREEIPRLIEVLAQHIQKAEDKSKRVNCE